MSENRVKSIYLAVGSNLGNKKVNIEKAKFQLVQNKIKILKSSSYYETLSWPNINNPKFLNIVLEISTDTSVIQLFKICKKIEKNLGRIKRPKNAPRECDIDVIDFKGLKTKEPITLPHPRMHKRNFVLFPFFEINKVWKHPILKQNIKKLMLSLPISDIRSIKQI